MINQFGQVRFYRTAKSPMSLDLLGSELILSGQGDRLKTVTDADLHRPIKGSISGIEELKVTINNAVRRHDNPRPWPGAKPAPQYSAMPVVPSVWHLRLERAARGTNLSWCRSRKHVAPWGLTQSPRM